MENLEYLYHYTNIETLALILRNKTIRFNSLNRMDDKQEQETADIKNIGQFCYISSWTDIAEESIPMWAMYASLDSGVRIKLRKNPFIVYANNLSEFRNIPNLDVQYEEDVDTLPSLIPLKEMLFEGYYSNEAITRDILFKVEYTDNPSMLYPRLINGSNIFLGMLGRYKNKYWEFQSEWRYKLLILPLNTFAALNNINSLREMVCRILAGTEKQPLPYRDLIIDEEAFSDMEITMCPKISKGNEIIVRDLIEKYNSSALLRNSDLSNLI